MPIKAAARPGRHDENMMSKRLTPASLGLMFALLALLPAAPAFAAYNIEKLEIQVSFDSAQDDFLKLNYPEIINQGTAAGAGEG